jgi:hypothetical protein
MLERLWMGDGGRMRQGTSDLWGIARAMLVLVVVTALLLALLRVEVSCALVDELFGTRTLAWCDDWYSRWFYSCFNAACRVLRLPAMRE